MKLNKNKRGISIIVLVITIVVMIILAAAIILSLNSSNISSRAVEARTTSDLSNKKEAASVYLSEYEINLAKGKIYSTTTANEYVRKKLKKAGIDISDVAVTEDKDILVGIAAIFVNNKVAIGTEVKGYKLNTTTQYTTSGKEDTYNTKTELPIITRDENITWKYMGFNENGEALIVGSVTSNSPNMMLGGKGGYLYGPQELNDACKTLYSGSMGIARSINIEDVIRVLEYTGEKASYYDTNGEYKELPKVITINELANEIGYDIEDFLKETPESGKDIGSYKADFYLIGKNKDKNEYNSTNQDIVNLIYPGTTTENPALTTAYWLSSTYVNARFSHNYARFGVGYIYSDYVNSHSMLHSNGTPYCCNYKMRPVVSLKSNVQLKYENSSWIIY